MSILRTVEANRKMFKRLSWFAPRTRTNLKPMPRKDRKILEINGSIDIDIPISPNTELVTGAESAEVVDSSSYTALSAGDILPEAETSSPAIPTLANSIPLRPTL